MRWSEWAGPLATLVLALAGPVAAGPISTSSLTASHHQLDRRDAATGKWALFQADHQRNTDDHWRQVTKFRPDKTYGIWDRDPAPKESAEELKKQCHTPCDGDPVEAFKPKFLSSLGGDQDVFPIVCVCEKITDDKLADFFRNYSQLPIVHRRVPFVAIRKGDEPAPNNSNVFVFPTEPTDASDLLLRGVAALYSPDVEKEFKQALDKDTCVARQDALTDSRKAFAYAAVLYQNLWRYNTSQSGSWKIDTKPYHDANLSCMYFQLRAVGKLVWQDKDEHLMSPKTLYPLYANIENYAGATEKMIFELTEMPCAKDNGKIVFAHNPVKCKKGTGNYSDPEEGMFLTGNGKIISKDHGIIEEWAAKKKDFFNPGRPTYNVPDFTKYEDTHMIYKMNWHDNKTKENNEQMISLSLYPASACDA
ncbi:hypothetical protein CAUPRSCDRAFT_11935 [Caulochytrium protostelioides]|uniref:Uncharacterized protein n=1 Tax=Caulochytrium protostelioides TaxID=1555241 RepID=A0A4P9WT70_9FUNG|nr:hypothetical protein CAUPRSCDRAFT_11935 [Caulochytrium protostelioides]